jgi:uncharacterized delta-60 repeat protein
MKTVERLERRALLTALNLDPAFADDGIATADFDGWSREQATAVAIDASDRPVVVGSSTNGKLVARFTASGALDTTFASPPGSYGAVADDVLVQSNGGIIVAWHDDSRIVIERYQPNGEIDYSFGSYNTPQFSFGFNHPVAIAQASNGDILVAATDGFRAKLIRLSSTGTLHGVSDVPSPSEYFSRVADIAVDANGHILVLGNGSASETFHEYDGHPFLTRLLSNGTVNSNFGVGGVLAMNPQVGNYVVPAQKVSRLITTPSNGYVIAGAHEQTAALWNVSTDGTINTAFGAAGGRVTATGPGLEYQSRFADVALVGGNRLVGIGSSSNGDYEDHVLGMFDLNGAPDVSFHADGVRRDNLGLGLGDGAADAAVDSQGRLVVAGRIAGGVQRRLVGRPLQHDGNAAARSARRRDLQRPQRRRLPQPRRAGHRRPHRPHRHERRLPPRRERPLDHDGLRWHLPLREPHGRLLCRRPDHPAGWRFSFATSSGPSAGYDVLSGNTTTVDFATTANPPIAGLDSSFGNAGRSSAMPFTNRSVVTPTGSVLGLRYLSNGTTSLERYSAAGAFEATVTTFPAIGSPLNFSIDRILLRPDGKIVFAGNPYSGPGVTILQFNADGTRDATFGTNGLATLSSSIFGVSDFALSPVDGRLFAYGNSGRSVLAVRANGTIETTFGTSGLASLTQPYNANHVGIDVDPSGRSYVLADDGGLSTWVTRLTVAGKPDTTFGTTGNGRVVVQLPSPTNNRIYVRTLAFLPDGKILAAGDRQLSGERSKMMAMRLNANGSVDAAFGQSGYAVIDFPRGTSNTWPSAQLLRLAPDGGMFLIGTSRMTTASCADVAVARLTAAGQLDAFWNGGKVTAAFGSGSDSPTDAYVRPDGRLTVYAYFSENSVAALTSATFKAPTLPASISGLVWNDVNGNGTKDTGEVGIAGRTLFLDDDNDNVLDAGESTSTTDANGAYQVGGLFAGTHRVRQVLPPGWSQTSPASGGAVSITLVAGQEYTGANFGARGDIGPTVTASAFTFETAMRFGMTFNESVAGSLTAEDITIVNLATNAAYPLPNWSLAASGASATITLLTSTPDANYQVRIRANGVASSTGATNPAAINLPSFFILAGDANRDRTVNFDDLLILGRNYNQSGRTFSQGNFNHSADGLANFDDLLILARRYGTTLALPPAAAAASAADTNDERGSPASDILA